MKKEYAVPIAATMAVALLGSCSDGEALSPPDTVPVVTTTDAAPTPSTSPESPAPTPSTLLSKKIAFIALNADGNLKGGATTVHEDRYPVFEQAVEQIEESTNDKVDFKTDDLGAAEVRPTSDELTILNDPYAPIDMKREIQEDVIRRHLAKKPGAKGYDAYMVSFNGKDSWNNGEGASEVGGSVFGATDATGHEIGVATEYNMPTYTMNENGKVKSIKNIEAATHELTHLITVQDPETDFTPDRPGEKNYNKFGHASVTECEVELSPGSGSQPVRITAETPRTCMVFDRQDIGSVMSDRMWSGDRDVMAGVEMQAAGLLDHQAQLIASPGEYSIKLDALRNPDETGTKLVRIDLPKGVVPPIPSEYVKDGLTYAYVLDYSSVNGDENSFPSGMNSVKVKIVGYDTHGEPVFDTFSVNVGDNSTPDRGSPMTYRGTMFEDTRFGSEGLSITINKADLQSAHLTITYK